MAKNENDIGAIILAGGKSRRFGTDKACYQYRGRPLIHTVIEVVRRVTDNIIVVTNNPHKTHVTPYPKYRDIYPNTGPLGGIYTGLTYSNYDVNIVLPCDMPYITYDCLNYLLQNKDGNDVVVPLHQNYLEPLCAIYSKSCLPFIQAQLERDDYQVVSFYDKVNTKKVPFSKDTSCYHQHLFHNINSKQDLDRFYEYAF